MTTEKPNPLRGYRETQETTRDPVVDPKRFQEELNKVTESDEAQKRQKRNLKKSEEEGEEEEVRAPVQASGELFAGFMSTSEGTSMMSPQTPQNVRSTQAPTSSSNFTIEEDKQPPFAAEKPPAQDPQASSQSLPFGGGGLPTPTMGESFTPKESEENSFPTENAFIESPETFSTTPSPQQQATTSTDSSKAPEESSTTASPPRVQKQQHKDTSLLGKKGPSKAHLLKQKKETSVAPIRFQKQSAKQPSESTKTSGAKQPTSSSTPQPKPIPKQPTPSSKQPLPPSHAQQAHAASQQLPTLGKTEQKPLIKGKHLEPPQGRALETTRSEQSRKTHTDTSRDHSKDKDEKHESDTTAVTPSAVPITPFHVQEAQAPAPSYTTLSPDVYEIFEKMVGVMMIESHQGVTTTTVTINMKDSVFNGAKITLDHYSTAPNAFNVTIAGSPEAQELINANLGSLAAAFEQSKLAFQVNLRRPILLEEHQAIRRKGKSGEEEGGDKKKKK